jgi:hypothetical protein
MHIHRRPYTCRTHSSGRYEEAFVPESFRQTPRRPTVVVPSLALPRMASDFQLLLPRRGPCIANLATDRWRSNAASYCMQRTTGTPLQHTTCKRKPPNCRDETVRYSQTVTSRRNALAALQVNDYPMPMTPTAATSTEMLPMPPLAQTGEVARTEASPAHRNMSSVPLDSKSSHRDGRCRHGRLDSRSRLHSRCMCW